MHRAIAIALLAAVAGPQLRAQMRGGAGTRTGAVTAVRGRPARAPTLPGSSIAPGTRVFVPPGGFGHPGFVHSRFRHHHHFLFTSCFSPFANPFACQSAFFGAPLITSFPLFWPDVPQDYSTTTAAAAPQYPPDTGLRADLERLTREVEALREEQQARNAPPPKPAATEAEPRNPTLLVFRDGHRLEIQNYGIVGETLWIFSERRARKLPLAELDLAKTREVNEERGVEFLGKMQ